MKLKRTTVFIAGSALALALLLFIQVQSVVKTARIKEELFNEKASIVLSRTAEELCADEETCKSMGQCCMADSLPECKLVLGKQEIKKIDSLLSHFMKVYNFRIEYSFEVIKPNTSSIMAGNESSNIFKKRLEEVVSKSGLELKLVLPDKKQFIVAEMGILFISSVLLIIVILIFFWITVRSLFREKQISEHTTDFLNNMTHEFKTPLTNIALAGKMIVSNTNIENPSKIKHYSTIILDENEKLRNQVEQVLSMVALERGEIPLVKTEVNFHDVIKRAVKYIGIQIEEKGGELVMDLSAEKFNIVGDKNHLGNAISNLIDNAIKYSEEKPEISIRTFNESDTIVIIVSDKGIGIDKKFQKHVFDKFFRVSTNNVHNVKGFGLGLAYVKKIIELHNGSIDLSSELKKGSSFKITLPLSGV